MNRETIFVWPDGEWCNCDEGPQQWKSDDYVLAEIDLCLLDDEGRSTLESINELAGLIANGNFSHPAIMTAAPGEDGK